MADTPTNPPAGGPINPPVADNEPEISPAADLLLSTREICLDGKSVYGDPNGRRAQEKLQEIDANLVFLRGLGEAPPAPEPWAPERAARERLAQEFPDGNPATTPWHPAQRELVTKQVAALGALSTAEQADLYQALVDSLRDNASAATVRHSATKNGVGPSGSQILNAMLKDAEPAVLALAKAGEIQQLRDALKFDRNLLERFAVRGRNITNFQAAAARYGVK